MRLEDRAAEFVRYAASRKRVAGARGDVVKLMRWHAPMVGREDAAALPILRNRRDVRRWASLARAHPDFRAASEKLWLEFVGTLDDLDEAAGIRAARSLDDLDAGQRRLTIDRTMVEAWAGAFGDRPVSARQLCGDGAVHEAMADALGLPVGSVGVTPQRVAALARRLVGVPLALAYRVVRAHGDPHSKVSRWKLEPAIADDGRPDPSF